MGVLRKKGEPTETETVRVPDLNATLSDAVVRVTKQIGEELRQVNGKGNGVGRVSGLATGARGEV